MARIKRFYRGVWQRTPSGTWDRIGLGRQIAGPPSRDYNPEYLNHRDDKLEAIIGESVDDQGRAILLAKWKGFPVCEATWELEWRFTIEELLVWDTEMKELDEIEGAVDGKPTKMKEGRDLMAICSIQREILVGMSEPIKFQPIKQMQEYYAARRQNRDSVIEGAIRRLAKGQQHAIKEKASYEAEAKIRVAPDENEEEKVSGEIDVVHNSSNNSSNNSNSTANGRSRTAAFGIDDYTDSLMMSSADNHPPVSSPRWRKAAHILLELKASDPADSSDECLKR